VELLPYLTSGFGHPTRIDYGTGHETSFVLFLYCLFRMQVLQQDDMAVRRIQWVALPVLIAPCICPLMPPQTL
jgi:hypothetical protein